MKSLLAGFALLLTACASTPPPTTDPYTVVLGIAQDGGYPQAGCEREDCIAAWRDPSRRHRVASLGIVDPLTNERWLIDATPDFPSQLHSLGTKVPTGILLTHAHIGHYVGLAHLGREVMGARGVRVYAMPRMREFLERNGPWSQLVSLQNISVVTLQDNEEIALNARIRVTPIRVPHRDEFSETVGFIIRGPSRSVLYLPDIDKWEKWSVALEDVLARVDVAYLDGTFYTADELPGRDLREIPHPLITETLARLAGSPLLAKVRFIHLNQSNPLLGGGRAGVVVGREGERYGL